MLISGSHLNVNYITFTLITEGQNNNQDWNEPLKGGNVWFMVSLFVVCDDFDLRKMKEESL